MKADYNEEEDILYLSKANGSVKYSLNVNDLFVIDFNANDKVVGIEILDASEALYKVSRDILKNILSAKFGVQYGKELLVIGITLKSKLSPTPICASVPIPIAK